MSADTNGKKIHILRHGQAIHNVQRGYPFRDPPLTDEGLAEARAVCLGFQPDLIICSPMTRTIQTALAVFPDLLSQSIPVEIWPDMREAHDAICNKGLSRTELSAAFLGLDFSRCSQEWDYEAHSPKAATSRAERVRAALAERPEQNILIVGHRGFIDYLVAGPQFSNCELRSYTLGPDDILIHNEGSHGS
ncbi:phosphoglycerate mutase-like protein [Mycena galopus ATCC 62051]|nr:phosphoglycerate mutase-like protein [Mycena galopus ATCC 62051]